MSTITQQLEYLSNQIYQIQASKAALILLKNPLEEMNNESVNAYASWISIHVKTRAEWAKIRASLPHQKWEREVLPDSKSVKYTYRFGLTSIDCTVGELPPSCVVVEEEVDVPEQIIPARKEIRKTIKCKKDGEQTTENVIEEENMEVPF